MFAMGKKIILVCLFLPLSTSAFAAEAAKAESYLKVTPAKPGQTGRVETSVTRFMSMADPSLVVDLVGVIHIGEKAYYEKLDEHLKQYDIVLYELIGPKGSRPIKGKGKGSYQAVAKALKLIDQFDGIDYE